MTSNQKTEILRLRSVGLGYRSIAERIGVSEKTVASFCRAYTDKEKTGCEQCGRMISQDPHRKKKRFCSDRCRMLWWNGHRDKVSHRTEYERTCLMCGKRFISYTAPDRKYCSTQCYAEHRRKNG